MNICAIRQEKDRSMAPAEMDFDAWFDQLTTEEQRAALERLNAFAQELDATLLAAVAHVREQSLTAHNALGFLARVDSHCFLN